MSFLAVLRFLFPKPPKIGNARIDSKALLMKTIPPTVDYYYDFMIQ